MELVPAPVCLSPSCLVLCLFWRWLPAARDETGGFYLQGLADEIGSNISSAHPASLLPFPHFFPTYSFLWEDAYNVLLSSGIFLNKEDGYTPTKVQRHPDPIAEPCYASVPFVTSLLLAGCGWHLHQHTLGWPIGAAGSPASRSPHTHVLPAQPSWSLPTAGNMASSLADVAGISSHTQLAHCPKVLGSPEGCQVMLVPVCAPDILQCSECRMGLGVSAQ